MMAYGDHTKITTKSTSLRAILNRRCVSVKKLKKLIDDGADVNTCNRRSYTAMHYACSTANHDLVNFLTLNNIGIDGVEFGVKSPLFMAIENKDVLLCEKLLNCGADPNYQYRIPGVGVVTPIVWLFIYHREHDARVCDIFNILVTLGAKYRENDIGFSLIHCVKNVSIMEYLLRGRAGGINSLDGNGITPLVYAVRRKDYDMVRLILYFGANPNKACKGDKLAIHHAGSDSKMIEVLMLGGSYLKVVDSKGRYPLAYTKLLAPAKYFGLK
jgi:ankyrin repeat protein